jgi:flagellar hook-associated protein 2
MSDISIPGVSSKYNTDKMIEAIMEAERIPLKRMEDRKDDYAERKKVWNEVNRKLNTLQTSARSLYSFESPFREYIAASSDEDLLTAVADRNAGRGSYELSVRQVASVDSFRSKPLPEDFKVPKGEYRFSVGDQEINFSFKGGDLTEFAGRLNQRGRDIVEADVVKDTRETRVLVIRSALTGAANRLSFGEDARGLGLDSGMLKRIATGERDILLSPETVEPYRSPGLDGEIQTQSGELQLSPRAAATLKISPPVRGEGKLQVEITLRLARIEEDEYVAPKPPPGPDIPPAGGIELEGIEIQDAPNRIDLPEWNPPPPPKRVDSLEILTANGTEPLPEVRDTEEIQRINFPLSNLGKPLESIQVVNQNTHRRVTVSSVRIVNPEARGEFQPQFPVSTAANAIIEINGIPIERENNEIDDVIPGVTLQPRKPSNETIELSIEADKEAIKDGLIAFLASYNQVLTEINILSGSHENVVEEIGYFDEKEKEAAFEKLGLFVGDTTFMQLKNRLQRIVTSAYETSAGRDLAMLSQMGISTNASGASGGLSRSKLRGYLEVDESKVDEAIDTNLKAMSELFGRDTDGDLVVDSGLAVEIHNFVNAYTRTGGLIDTRTAGLDRQIADTEDQITDFKTKLEDKEKDLKREYGIMESTLGQLEGSQRSLENFSNRNTQ